MKNGRDFEQFRSRMKKQLAEQYGEDNIAAFWGNQGAKIVSISQAPSTSALKSQKPFDDKSGERLRKQWYKVSEETFYNQDNFYFTSIGMYYPGKGKTGDLKPSLAMANKWLKEEISFLNPRLFLIVGSFAAAFFFPGKKFTDLVFTNQTLLQKPALVLPHPSPINKKWFKDHPKFEEKRLKRVQEYIHQVLNEK